MKLLQVRSWSDVWWWLANIPDSYYRLSNKWKSHKKQVQKLILVSIKSQLACKIGGAKKRREVECTKPSTIVDDEDYILELEKDIQSTSDTLKLLKLDVGRPTQLQEECETDTTLLDSITNVAGSVTSLLVSNLETEMNADTEVDE